jgi:hypothetical protein
MSASFRRHRTVLALLAALAAPALAQSAAAAEIEAYKSPTCGGCNDWIRHRQANGLTVNATDVPEPRHYRARFGMPQKLGSCQTALVDGYVIEGHVPARAITRLLRERPKALGLSVPGMPVGSPGMDGPEYNGQVDPYDVLLVQADGRASVFASYEPGPRR